MNQLEISFGTPLRVVVQNEPPPIAVWLTIWYDSFKITAKGGEVMYTLPVDHYVEMQVAYMDSGGNPAKVDGDVTWRSSDDTIAMAEADPGDSTLVKVTPVGALGQVQIVATADADLGTGVRALITTTTIEIVAGEAVSGTISPVGDPVPIA